MSGVCTSQLNISYKQHLKLVGAFQEIVDCSAQVELLSYRDRVKMICSRTRHL